MTERGPMRATLTITQVYRLPAACTPERDARGGETVDCVVVSEVSLTAHARRVEVRTIVENAARDHRLRVRFPVGFRVEHGDAEGVFEVTRRPARQPSHPRAISTTGSRLLSTRIRRNVLSRWAAGPWAGGPQSRHRRV